MVAEVETSTSNTSASKPTYPIKTVVVLVQENRSFDHILGWLKSENPEINGVTGSESNLISTSDPTSKVIHFSDRASYVEPDPDHSIQAIFEQVFGFQWNETALKTTPEPKMNGFAQNAERTLKGLSEAVMSGFKHEALPVYKELAANFGICDRWFASVPASTQPNRMFVHSGTSHGLERNDTKLLISGLPQKTIFDSLDEEGFSFGIYYQSIPSTLFYRSLRKLKFLKHFHLYGLEFERHCKEGKLPNYVVIEQRFWDILSIPANDDHPSHDVSQGQKFIKEVYETLRSSPQWNEMLFVIVYDEHGGFYDHVPTPVKDVPSPDGLVGPEPYYFKFDRLGVRVPAFFISPWIEPGVVLHAPNGPHPTSEYEHSSIPATVKKIFNLKNFLTKRDEWAGTFEDILSLTRDTPRTDCPVTLGEPVKLRDTEAKEGAPLSDFQRELVQLAAVLCGDHKKDTYPDKFVEGMTVEEAAKYVENAFKKFCEVGEQAKANGANDNEVIVCSSDSHVVLNEENVRVKSNRNFVQKFFSCLVCDN